MVKVPKISSTHYYASLVQDPIVRQEKEKEFTLLAFHNRNDRFECFKMKNGLRSCKVM